MDLLRTAGTACSHVVGTAAALSLPFVVDYIFDRLLQWYHARRRRPCVHPWDEEPLVFPDKSDPMPLMIVAVTGCTPRLIRSGRVEKYICKDILTATGYEVRDLRKTLCKALKSTCMGTLLSDREIIGDRKCSVLQFHGAFRALRQLPVSVYRFLVFETLVGSRLRIQHQHCGGTDMHTNGKPTFLHCVCYDGRRPDLLRFLVTETDVGKDIRMPDLCGQTPLHWAMHWPKIETIRFLLLETDAYKDLYVYDHSGSRPLDGLLAFDNRPCNPVIQFCLEQGYIKYLANGLLRVVEPVAEPAAELPQ